MIADFYQSIQGNAVLFWFGVLTALGACITTVLMLVTQRQISGVNAYLKPTKFYISIAIFSFTMAYFTQFLTAESHVLAYSWGMAICLGFELLAITFQAARGKRSHFNVDSPFDGIVFTLMGIMIVIAMVWTAYMGYRFFVQPEFAIDMTLVWGIRLGIIISVIFAFQGGYMASKLRHTVGADDGGDGLPFVNWSKQHGDLRVAHFLGIHALQAIPLFGAFIAQNSTQVFVFAAVFFIVVSLTFYQALQGKPMLPFKK